MKSFRLIIIEDHTMIRQLLSDVVQSSKIKIQIVAAVGTVAAGLVACVELKPDLVIVDLMLPDGSGLQLVKNLRPQLQATKFIVLTSNDDQAIVQDVHAAGVEGFLLKRSSMETLGEALTAVTAGSTYYCAESKEILASPPLVQRVRNSVALTPREREIICSIANGFGTKETAERLHVSAKTIANHFAALKDKLNIHETSGLVRYAIKQGWVDAP